MKNKLVPVICSRCRHWTQDVTHKSYGVCSKDEEVTKSHWACSKLPTDNDRRDAKINNDSKILIGSAMLAKTQGNVEC